jgi:predicted AlkP superfamily phosphohydrolase/phosphomutase
MTQVLLIGLDGATFYLLERYFEDGLMPTLAELVARGARSELRSTPHPFTPPAWTTLSTGVGPGVHGIFDFVRVLPGLERPQYTMATSHDVRAETVWSIASRSGCRVTCLNFPVTFPPRPIDGYLVPGFVPPRHLRRSVHPLDLYDRLRALPGFSAEELLLNLDLERESLQTLPDERYEDWIRLHIRREAQWASIAEMLLEEESCELTAVIFDGVDKLQHLCWRFLDPCVDPRAPAGFAERIEALCREYFAAVDGHIAALIQAAGEDTDVVVCSDHGFGPTDEIFYPNVVLERAGFLGWADGAAIDANGRHTAHGHRNPTVLFDWDRTVACALTSGSNGVYLTVPGAADSVGRESRGYLALREEVAEALLSYVDPSSGEPVVREVLRREDAFPGEHSFLAPDLTLVLRDHGFPSILRAKSPLTRRDQTMGTHAPDGILIGSGPAFQRAHPERVEIAQVAPLVLHLLGVAIPIDLEGRLPAELLDPAWLDAHPPEFGAPSDVPATYFERAATSLGRRGEELVLDRLRALGYVE